MSKIIAKQDWGKVEQDYFASSPFSFVVLDDFLTMSALNEIKEMLVNDGNWARKNWQVNQLFNREPPLPRLQKLLSELGELAPSILGDFELVKHWAVACHENEGLHVHSDNASIAVNFWITDDCYNLDDTTGGMLLYKLKRTDQMRVHEFNAMPWSGKYFDDQAPELLTKIPYRRNRAVIFDAKIFHSTDVVNFKSETLESVRIGVTMALDEPSEYHDRMRLYSEAGK